MSHKLVIEAYSSKTPRSKEELNKALSRLQPSQNGEYLAVLPEYFIDGSDRYDGRSLEDEMVTTVVDFTKQHKSHLAFGMVEKRKDTKHITGVFVGPDGIIGTQHKKSPTHFERESGIEPSDNDFIVFDSGNNWTLSIISCIDIFTYDEEIRQLPSDIFVNVRGFDLDDRAYGSFSKSWLRHNQDLAIMGKRIVVGATGNNGQPGPLAEIIDFEGDAAVIYNGSRPARAVLDLNQQQAYRRGEYISKFVPIFK